MQDLAEHLRELSQVKKGDSILDAITADRINAIQGAIKSLARGDGIKTAGGLSKTSTTNAVILRGPEKTHEFVPQLEPFEVRVLGLPASYKDGYSSGHYVTCHLGYVTNLVDSERYRPDPASYNSTVYAIDDTNGSVDMGWFKGDSLSPGGSDVHVWLEYVTDLSGRVVASPDYQYSHTSPSIWFTTSSAPPIAPGPHADPYSGTRRYRFIHIATVHYDSLKGFVVEQHHKGNVFIDYEISTPAGPPPWLSPWQCYVTEMANNSCTVRINPISTLMKQQSHRSYLSDWEWDDKISVTNFSNPFTLTSSTDKVWMKVPFDQYGKISTPEILHGATGGSWSNYPSYQDASTTEFGSSASFEWRQLLAYFKYCEAGDPVDAIFGGVNYRLVCPTTTHLAEGIVRGSYGTNRIRDYPAIIPWHGCYNPGGS